MSLFSLLSVARDGILANAGALQVTSQNVAGASTPGYVRRAAVLEARPQGGVAMAGVSRGFDRFAYEQLVKQESLLSAARARSQAMVEVEALAAPGANDLAERASALLAAFHEMALHPADAGVRSTVLARAEALAAGFSETADGLESLRADLLTRARDVAAEVNTRLEQLAELDRQIVQATGGGDTAPDLRDRRDQLVREVADRIGARAIEDPRGGITLFGGGAVLLDSGVAATVSVSLDASGALRIESLRNGATTDLTASVEEGTLGGIREARDSDVTSVLAELDAYAFDVADLFNGIHAAGYGLDGGTGRPLFTAPGGAAGAAHAMALDPDLVGHPERLAAASSASDLPGGSDVAVALARAGQATLAGGGTISERFASMTGRIGVLRASTAGEELLREDTVASAATLRESVSGVSTDEEMIRLQQFQRGFEASTRVLRTIETLFDTLLGAF